MASTTKRVIAVVGWDNRCPIDYDVSAQLTTSLNNGVYVVVALTISRLVQASMTAPLAGSNQIAIEMLVPGGTSNATIIALVTAAINALVLPTVPTITVSSVLVF
jgi:hypothetical protein